MTRVFAALILFTVAQACIAQELGRLFFTPDERAALDARRRARMPDKPAAAVIASPTTKLDGYVKRSGGPSTVWVNGEALPEGTGEAPRIGPRVSIPLGEGGRRAALRPGEVLDRGTGEIRDVIGDGTVQVRPAQ